MHLFKRMKLEEEDQLKINKLNQKIEESSDFRESLTISLIHHVENLLNYNPYLQNSTSSRKECNEFDNILNDYIDTEPLFLTISKEITNYSDEIVRLMGPQENLAYWRKFHDLDYFFGDIFAKRNSMESFNCIPLNLGKNDCASALDFIIKNKVDLISYKKGSSQTICEKTLANWNYSQRVFEYVLKSTNWEKEELIYYNSW